MEVCSQGRVIPRYGSTDVIASVGVPLEIVNPTTSFGCGSTDRNSYIFSWTNAVVGRVLHEEVAGAEAIDASIELFRNGDVGITTNGVTELIPRVLPFPHDGFGQDEEWIAANFTNATEILAVGYPQWVDAQVGENLTNGLYKFTVTIPDVPPETIQLVVGDYSVAVTNSGDYVFLLEKGAYYEVDFSYLPYGVAYAWSYRICFIVLAVVALVSLLLPTIFLKETDFITPKPTRENVLKSLTSTFKNKDFGLPITVS